MLKAWGVQSFVAAMFWILTKEPGTENTRTVPFILNRVQAHLLANLAHHNRVLKARQAGLTTFMMIVRLLLPVITEGGKTGLLISQNGNMAGLHFQIARRATKLFGALDPLDDTTNGVCTAYRENLLHTQYSNRRELLFDMLDSKLIVESAEVEEAAQGVTLHHVLASEVARWPGNPEATTSNIKGALAPSGTYDEESTANGFGGYFFENFMRGMNEPTTADARSHYYSWFWSDEYSLSVAPENVEEMLKDLTADEYRLIRLMHKELELAA